RALVEFIFQAQGVLIFHDQMHAIAQALREFHHFKNAIITAGGRQGKRGAILHFNIPKLEGMGRVVFNAEIMGAPFQYTSDITERCHIFLVKEPYRHSNRRDYHEQCVRYMDRDGKIWQFRLFTSISASGTGLVNRSRPSLLATMVDEASHLADHYPEATWLSNVLPSDEYRIRGAASKPCLFSNNLRSRLSDDLSTAFLVNVKPHYPRLSIYDATQKFHLPDFRGALGDYFDLQQDYAMRKGQRKSSSSCMLPFSHVDVWTNLRMQQHSSQDPRILLPVTTVQALPPSAEMPHGRCNTVLINNSTSGSSTISSGDSTFDVVQLRLIFSPIYWDNTKERDVYCYAESFRFSPAHRVAQADGSEVFCPVPDIDMFLVNRHYRGDGVTRMGDIIKMTDIREVLELAPVFGKRMRDDMDCNNSLEIANSFYINNFADKETFHAILSYQ
ncbi:hypothetical protein FIBSPDRAFT_734893, partial [Athelia psychrophila]